MTEKETLRLRQYCARILTEYGFEFSPNDPVLPALYTIHRELNANKVGNEAVAKSIKEALEKLNPTVYNFNERGEAWKFKMAESVRWLFAGASLIVLMGIGLIWWRQHNNVQLATEIINSYSRVHRLLMLSAKKDEKGFMYLEFSKAHGDFIANWTEYHQLKKDTIRVYLGKPD